MMNMTSKTALKTTAAVLTLAAALTLTACSKDTVSDVQQFIDANGRDYGKTATAELNERQDNSFFALTATEAFRLSTLGGYLPVEGSDFVAVYIKTTNIFTETIPMSLYDFNIRWGDGENDFIQAESLNGADNGYGFKDYSDEISLNTAASAEGYVYFEVPKSATDLRLEYIELYEDDFAGSTYYINLGNPTFYADDIKPGDLASGTGEADPEFYYAGMNEVIANAYSTMEVTEAFRAREIGGVTADEGWDFLVVEMTLTNTDIKSTFGAQEFLVAYDDEDGIDYSIEVGDAFPGIEGKSFPEAAELDTGESVTGYLYFSIPSDSDDIDVFNVEYFNDGSTGNYSVFELGNPETR